MLRKRRPRSSACGAYDTQRGTEAAVGERKSGAAAAQRTGQQDFGVVAGRLRRKEQCFGARRHNDTRRIDFLRCCIAHRARVRAKTVASRDWMVTLRRGAFADMGVHTHTHTNKQAHRTSKLKLQENSTITHNALALC